HHSQTVAAMSVARAFLLGLVLASTRQLAGIGAVDDGSAGFDELIVHPAVDRTHIKLDSLAFAELTQLLRESVLGKHLHLVPEVFEQRALDPVLFDEQLARTVGLDDGICQNQWRVLYVFGTNVEQPANRGSHAEHGGPDTIVCQLLGDSSPLF